jgi:caffeoyl-CoA O-methyltransferase
VAGRVELRLGPALETLDQLLREGEAGCFDFAFVDADKREYQAYYERVLQLLRSGGLVAIDNVLWGGSVVDAKDDSEDTRAIRQFNAALAEDQRVDLSLIPIADGLTLARKR